MQSDKREEPSLDKPCQFLKGVGPRRAEDLARLGIYRVEDLLLHFPRHYLDLGSPTPLRHLKEGERCTVRGRIMAGGERKPRRGLSILSVLIDDGQGRLTLTFFNQPYLKRVLRNGLEIVAYGEVGRYGSALQMVAPEFEVLEEENEGETLLERTLLPVYPLTRGVGQRWLRRLLERVLTGREFMGELREILPQEWLRISGWPGRAAAIRQLHFPDDREKLDSAMERLKFDELFLLQMLAALRRHRRRSEAGPTMDAAPRLREALIAELSFKLTGAQESALEGIAADLASGERMQRLLQGDVGSGKTVVALLALLQAVESGWQGALMAPLEVLARQHHDKWSASLERLGVSSALLTGATSAKQRREILSELDGGSLNIIFGTQALIQDGVDFQRLGLAVVDEQHRFGVMQRARLLGGDQTHLLVMSATPIPRSLAMTLYGDMDLSIIDELPPGRPPIVTRLSREKELPRIHEFLRERLSGDDPAGDRAFLIYPLVEDNDKIELKAVTEEFEALKDDAFSGIACDIVHGRMSPARKMEALDGFRAGRSRLLMATTVIEVGIDIPEATIMLIHNPERFGLSQLHQLRGRIGRGKRKSYCILVAPESMGAEARARLDVFVRNRDGFKLAEEDLKLRGPGEIFGRRQHGRPELSLANPLRDAALVRLARERAEEIASRDPDLLAADLRQLRALLLRVFKTRMSLSEVG